jgi:uncharacterized protein (DUF427 family)
MDIKMKAPKDDRLMQAIWNGQVIAESDETLVVEGNNYFPPDFIRWQYFEKIDKHTFCPWKGQASYYDVVVKGERNHGAAWYYPDPYPKAEELKDYVGFWRGVEVKAVGE